MKVISYEIIWLWQAQRTYASRPEISILWNWFTAPGVEEPKDQLKNGPASNRRPGGVNSGPLPRGKEEKTLKWEGKN